jgi:hypothetical protein
MSPRRRPLPMTPDDPTGPDLAAGMPDTGAAGLDQGAVGQEDMLPDLSGGGGPPGALPPGADTGGLTDDQLEQIDLSALGDTGDPGLGGDPGMDPGADPAADPTGGQSDPELDTLMQALQGGGDPQTQQMAQQMLDLAARRKMAGA